MRYGERESRAQSHRRRLYAEAISSHKSMPYDWGVAGVLAEGGGGLDARDICRESTTWTRFPWGTLPPRIAADGEMYAYPLPLSRERCMPLHQGPACHEANTRTRPPRHVSFPTGVGIHLATWPALHHPYRPPRLVPQLRKVPEAARRVTGAVTQILFTGRRLT